MLLRFHDTNTVNQSTQFIFKGGFCRRRLPWQLGKFHIAAIGGGVRERGGGRGDGSEVEGRERSRRGRGIGGGSRRVSGQTLKDGSSSREGIIRGSHCALEEGEKERERERKRERGRI